MARVCFCTVEYCISICHRVLGFMPTRLDHNYLERSNWNKYQLWLDYASQKNITKHQVKICYSKQKLSTFIEFQDLIDPPTINQC